MLAGSARCGASPWDLPCSLLRSTAAARVRPRPSEKLVSPASLLAVDEESCRCGDWASVAPGWLAASARACRRDMDTWCCTPLALGFDPNVPYLYIIHSDVSRRCGNAQRSHMTVSGVPVCYTVCMRGFVCLLSLASLQACIRTQTWGKRVVWGAWLESRPSRPGSRPGMSKLRTCPGVGTSQRVLPNSSPPTPSSPPPLSTRRDDACECASSPSFQFVDRAVPSELPPPSSMRSAA